MLRFVSCWTWNCLAKVTVQSNCMSETHKSTIFNNDDHHIPVYEKENKSFPTQTSHSEYEAKWNAPSVLQSSWLAHEVQQSLVGWPSLSFSFFYLKPVSILEQNELGRIHFWKIFFLFFMYLRLFFCNYLNNRLCRYNPNDSSAEVSSSNFTFITDNKISSDKRKSPSQAGDCCGFYSMFCVSTTERVCVILFFLLTNWGASVIWSGIWSQGS